MNLEDVLLDSSRAAADRAVDIIEQKPAMFHEAYVLCMRQEGKMALRAARVVQLIAEREPQMFLPYFEAMVRKLTSIEHSSVKRSMLKILTEYDLSKDEELHGIIIDYCFGRMNDPGEEVAIRAYSMMILKRFIGIYPGLSGEFMASLQVMVDNAKATLSSYAGKVLKEVYRDAIP